VGISDVLNMWIGESERNLAALFEKARANRPAVARKAEASTLECLKTARNLVKYGGDGAYKDVEAYLKAHRLG
jgi:SpoVK/Ycf46/Vps4 family AAA+-type ATPase